MTCQVCGEQLLMSDFYNYNLEDGPCCCSKECCLKYLKEKCQEEEKDIRDLEWRLARSKYRIFSLYEEIARFINK